MRKKYHVRYIYPIAPEATLHHYHSELIMFGWWLLLSIVAGSAAAPFATSPGSVAAARPGARPYRVWTRDLTVAAIQLAPGRARLWPCIREE